MNGPPAPQRLGYPTSNLVNLGRVAWVFCVTGEDLVRFDLNGDGATDARVVLGGVGAVCVAVDPHTCERVYIGTFDRGVFVSEDSGESWRRPDTPPSDSRVLTLAASCAEDHVYAGTEPSNLYRSSDYGRSWELLPALRELPSEPRWSFPGRPWTHHVRAIALHPLDPGQLVVGIELGGVMRSSDGGKSWLDHNPQAHRDAHQLLTHPEAPDRVYEVAGQGVAVSEDRGATWRRRERGLDRRYAWAGAVDPADPDQWYVSVSRGPVAAHGDSDGQARVWRSDGDGWSPIDSWEKTPALRRMPYALLALGPGRLLVGLRGGRLLLSNDAGDGWRELELALPDVVALAA